MSEKVLFELAGNRTIAIQDRNQTFHLTCRRITDADWQAYFAGIVVTAEQQGKHRINTIDVTSPRLALTEAVLVDAQGYKVEGGIELSSIPGWQKKLPLSHRTRLGETLADVRPSQALGDFVIHAECEIVLLDATSTEIEVGSESGEVQFGMLKLSGLKHVMSTPTEAQYRRYSREANRSKVIGGSRVGRTVYQGCQPLLAKLYDELIVSVDGYCVNGVELTTDRAAIVREMDTLHKVMAAQELFQPQDTAQLAGGDEE